MIKYSPNQAYCTIAEFDPKIKRKYVCVEQTDNPYCLKISSVQVSQTNFYHFHLTIRVLGQLNLDLKKNVTVDLLDDENLSVWRDKAAFLVTDSQHLCELTAFVQEFLKTLHTTKGDYVLKFAYIKKRLVSIYVAEDSEDFIVGYLVAKEDRVLALYSDSEEIAHTLMEKYLNGLIRKKVTICTRLGSWQVEKSPSTHVQRIYRRHTRTIPSNINWNKVYALNVGLHII
ncbi:unnamed protein product [Enterobius vermicularis]|uniref:YitH acetyltransferase (GNAT) domain-containing protein n=1 Tax=Enterobius vermicularis TaxID=51028 RepID=A0A0N4VNE0_ENTVE|nr:unnamed protein product [Enterobius vermicularis]